MDIKDLEDAEMFQALFVKPLVDAVRTEVRPVVEGHAALRRRVQRLERNQKRAIWGLSATAALFSVGFGLVLDWLKSKLGL
jgi:hypothetical protein